MSEPVPQFAEIDQQRLRQLQRLGLEIRTVFDVGASNGGWSWAASQVFPEARFDLFEPLADVSPEYQRMLQDIQKARPGFHLHKLAVGARCGQQPMFFYPESPVGSTAYPLGKTPKHAVRLEVQVITLDEAVRKFGLPTPQLIKADTQGCELLVLEGATGLLPQVDALMLETWLIRGYGTTNMPLLHELIAWLRRRNFYLWDLGDEFRNEAGELVAKDVLFVNANSKISRLKDELVRAQGVNR